MPNKPFLLRAAHVLLHFSSQKPPSLLKRDGAARQREEWHLDIFQAKAVKVYGVPQEKGKETRQLALASENLSVKNGCRIG